MLFCWSSRVKEILILSVFICWGEIKRVCVIVIGSSVFYWSGQVVWHWTSEEMARAKFNGNRIAAHRSLCACRRRPRTICDRDPPTARPAPTEQWKQYRRTVPTWFARKHKRKRLLGFFHICQKQQTGTSLPWWGPKVKTVGARSLKNRKLMLVWLPDVTCVLRQIYPSSTHFTNLLDSLFVSFHNWSLFAISIN